MTPSAFAEKVRLRVNAGLTYHIETLTPAGTLQEAMHYAVLAPGKRLRPQLVYIAGELLDAAPEALDLPACAIELIHAYSLIHDDLPAMDDAPLRRGRPSCHRQFSEATAILAGDALQPLAFEILAQQPAPLQPDQRLKMTQVLATACGAAGMVSGQSLDLEGVLPDVKALLYMYSLKTGALFSACTELGAIAAGCNDNPLMHFTQHLGLAFQIQDDILDIECSATVLGKMQGIDQRNQKVTYPSLTSLEASRQKVTDLFEMAIEAIPFEGPRKQFLQAFAENLIQRTC